ncbi:MAG: M12 family metallopeptidase [Bacteroidota bacterium]
MVKRTAGRWTNGVIPFRVDEIYSPSHSLYNVNADIALTSARNRIETETNGQIQLIPWTNESDRLLITGNAWGTCYSTRYIGEEGIGRLGGEQMVTCDLDFNFNPAINSQTLVHEICHVLGLFHEQQRPDADNFIDMTPQAALDIINNGVRYETLIGSFDCQSVMLYGPNAGILRNNPADACRLAGLFNEPRPLTAGDLASLAYLYPTKTTVQSTWNQGWMATKPFYVNSPYTFWYQPNNGQVSISSLNDGGTSTFWSQPAGSWSTNITNILLLYAEFYPVGASKVQKDHLILSYERSTKNLKIYTVQFGLFGNPPISVSQTLSTTLSSQEDWTHFSHFTMDDKIYFLAYNGDTGKTWFYRVANDGSSLTPVWQSGTNWDNNWTHFEFFMRDNRPHLMAYKSSNGTFSFTEIAYSSRDSNGNHNFPSSPFVYIYSSYASLPSNWSSFVTYQHNNGDAFGTQEYMITIGNAGTVNIYHIGDNYDITLIGETTWSAGWDMVLPYSLGSNMHFLVYKPGSGPASFGNLYPRNWPNSWNVP